MYDDFDWNQIGTTIITYLKMNNNHQHPIFHGSVDWHSSVHGHLAILVLAKRIGNKKWKNFIYERLSNKTNLEIEFQYLKNNADFEFIYGRSWFLRLIFEL